MLARFKRSFGVYAEGEGVYLTPDAFDQMEKDGLVERDGPSPETTEKAAEVPASRRRNVTK